MKLIIFDYNGVLADDLDLHGEVYVRVLRRHGFEVTFEDVRNFLFLGPLETIRAIIKKTTGANPPDMESLIREKEKEYCEIARKRGILFPDTEKSVESLSKRFLLAIVSHSSFVQVECVFPKRILEKFSVCLWEDDIDIKKRKPDPSSVLAAAKRAGAEPKECAYVGDSPTDMVTARNAGMLAVGVSTGYHGKEALEEAGADIVFRNLTEMARHFSGSEKST